MDSIKIIKPLSTFLKPVPLIDLSNMDHFSSERWESNQGKLGEKQKRYFCLLQVK